jgi:hypothetical protein
MQVPTSFTWKALRWCLALGERGTRLRIIASNGAGLCALLSCAVERLTIDPSLGYQKI